MPQQQPNPHGDQCIFCQLIDNPQQLLVVGETDNFYAWLDINPRAKGHTMVVPKEHIESLLEFDSDLYHEAMTLTREVVEKAKEGLGADGASITVNIGEAGGQMMPHAYIQIFPRFEEDESAGTPTGAIFQHREDLKPELEDIKDSMSDITVDFGEGKTYEKHPESQKFKEESSTASKPTKSKTASTSSSSKAIQEAAKKATEETDEEQEESQEDLEEELEPEENESQEGEDEEKESEEPERKGGSWDGESFEWI